MKKDKILKSSAVVPKKFYVKRSADEQLVEIINEMGRPGYVLVARQMGKTNLLQNLIRENEDSITRFAYIDFSNIFETERECFQNIINMTFERNRVIFSEVEDEIKLMRSSNTLSPHKEHENELRVLLNKFHGKLIIILDEIDSLTNTTYSDHIFSQIRSIYFSRVNYPEMERLTYILSGVAEPSELIKNKKLSPFNIGEKILLDDFNSEQCSEFFKKVNLPINQDIKDQIYNWTSGNPRLTWDLTSEIENLIFEKGVVSNEDVDRTVERIYLTDFSLPPIDHIRDLVEYDRQLRNAVMQIKYEKGATLPDGIKIKL